MIESPLINPVTCPAITTAFLGDGGVCLVVGVAFRAVRSQAALGARLILSVRHLLQMIGPNASEMSAATRSNVVPFQAFAGRPDKEMVGEASHAVESEAAIAVLLHASQPQCASIRPARVDLGPETFGGRSNAVRNMARKTAFRSLVVGMSTLNLHLEVVLSGVMRRTVGAVPPLFILQEIGDEAGLFPGQHTHNQAGTWVPVLP